MRLLFSYLILTFLSGVGAAKKPHIFYSDDSWSEHVPQAALEPVDASAARLLIAERLGLSRFHSLKGIDESTIQAVNRIGSLVRAPLEGDVTHPKPRIMVVVEGLEKIEDVFAPDKECFGYEISSSPTPDANLRLLQDFASQALYLHENNAPLFRENLDFGRILNTSLQKIKGLPSIQSAHHGGIMFLHIGTLQSIAKERGAKDSRYQSAVTSIRSAIESLLDSARATDLSITFALYPSQQGIGNFFRRSDSPYGIYSVPKLGLNAPRQLDDLSIGVASEPSVEIATALLQNPTELYSSSSTITATSSASSSRPNSAPTGILPACFSSVTNCESVTNYCSGHGSCKAKYTYKDGKDGNEVTCYACICEADKQTTEDGKTKTVTWAGPACQKQDVSMEFWLLGGFTIFFVGLLSLGLSMLYTMGQEDLPSVIGAGVSGPRAK